MYKHKRWKHKHHGPWSDVSGAIWLIGLGFLFLTGWWWPGILILVGLNMVLDGVFSATSRPSFDDVEVPPASPSPAAPAPTHPPASEPRAAAQPSPFMERSPEHPFELLPHTCPRCGGPVRRAEVKWTNTRYASCAYCGSNLPLKQTG